MPFKEIDSNPNFVDLEHQVAEIWEKKNILEKYLNKNKGSNKKWFFQDGPITANNPMGVHHAWGRTLKDFYQRYHNMNGFEERFQNGFDCQGLWVEVEVEKELGFKDKKDIEIYGIAKFVEKCKDRVRKYSAIQTKQSQRLGYFMDWDHSYYTMSDENNYMIWHFLKVCHEKGWLYKGWDSVPWCPRCGTAISQHEILTEEYKDLSHDSVFVKFKLKQHDAYLLVWTTTPWTLPANVAIALHPDLKYSFYESLEKKETYVFIDDSEVTDQKFLNDYIEIRHLHKIKTVSGSDLLGEEYEGIFDDLPAVQKAKKENSHQFHTLLAFKDLVDPNEGTGLVHIAPGCGKEDYDLSIKENIVAITPIDAEANYFSGYEFLSGQNVKDTNSLIFNYLQEKGFLYKIQKYTHRYPTCWRCKTELVFRLVEEWYIAMDKKAKTTSQSNHNSEISKLTLREQMIEVAKKIKWIPSFGLDRELDWLENMHDWLISKKRYWGLALPIWVCSKCGEIEVIGSKEELHNKAATGWEKFNNHSPHRPYVDEIKLKCPKCGAEAIRIKDVGNPWLDAGIVPYSTLIDPETGKLSYTDDQKYWQKWFPADLVLECFPGQFKNWFYAMIAMSTVLEMRNPYQTLLGYSLVKDEKGEEMHKSKGNAVWFDDAAEEIGVDVMRWMYSLQPTTINMKFGYNLANETRRRFHLVLWNVYKFFTTYANLDHWENSSSENPDLTILDKWILARLNETIKNSTHFIEKYQAYSAAEAIDSFVQDLSTWYLRRSRKRVGPTATNETDKKAFYSTMYQVFKELMKLLAPFIPYLSDYLYQNLTSEESVHLCSWPEWNSNQIDQKLLENMSLVRQIVEKGHAIRKEKSLKVRQPLLSLQYQMKASKLSKEFEDLVKDELNVKNLVYLKSESENIELVFDLKLTSELVAEGQMREIIRLIQDLRKGAKCQFNDQIFVYYKGSPEMETLFTKYKNEIKTQVLATSFLNEKKELSTFQDKKIDDKNLWIGIELVNHKIN